MLSDKDLIDNGYPRPDPGKPGHAVIHWSHYDKVPQNKGQLFILLFTIMLVL